jgi:hypothetical protein
MLFPTCFQNSLSLLQVTAGSPLSGNMKIQREFIISWWDRQFIISASRDTRPYKDILPQAPAK